MCRWQIEEKERERGKNAEMENRNQHMRKTGAMRGVAAEPAPRGFKARLSTCSSGKTKACEKELKKKPENPLKKGAKVLRGVGT